MRLTKLKGFTLMEMMIVVAIIAIIAAFAYPSYQNTIDKTYRNDAKGALIAFAANMERKYTENGDYCGNAVTTGGNVTTSCTSTTNDTGTPASFAIYVPMDSTAGNQAYDLTISDVTDHTFTVTATRTTGGRMASDECGDYSYNQTGVMSQSNNSTTTNCL